MRAHPLVTTAELAAILGRPDVKLLDASWRLGGPGMRDGWIAAHIPGAQFFDLDAISDRASPLPHMLPAAEDFAAAAGALGVRETDRIVIYDDGVFKSAPRVWWTFRVFGARDVRVLDGGLPVWRAEGRPVESGDSAPAPATFRAGYRPDLVRDYDAMLRIVQGGGAQIADSRPGDRFRAEAPEPRAGIRGGHMPGARSLPSSALYDGDRLKDAGSLRAAFAAAGIDPAQPVVSSCGSGVAAASVALALAVLGNEGGAVYDGSWTEWGGRPGSPIVTGPA